PPEPAKSAHGVPCEGTLESKSEVSPAALSTPSTRRERGRRAAARRFARWRDRACRLSEHCRGAGHEPYAAAARSRRRAEGKPLPGPEPAERAGCEQPVHRAVERVLERGDPGALVPDGGGPLGDRVRDERGGAGDPEHGEVAAARPE